MRFLTVPIIDEDDDRYHHQTGNETGIEHHVIGTGSQTVPIIWKQPVLLTWSSMGLQYQLYYKSGEVFDRQHHPKGSVIWIE